MRCSPDLHTSYDAGTGRRRFQVSDEEWQIILRTARHFQNIWARILGMFSRMHTSYDAGTERRRYKVSDEEQQIVLRAARCFPNIWARILGNVLQNCTPVMTQVQDAEDFRYQMKSSKSF